MYVDVWVGRLLRIGGETRTTTSGFKLVLYFRYDLFEGRNRRRRETRNMTLDEVHP